MLSYIAFGMAMIIVALLIVWLVRTMDEAEASMAPSRPIYGKVPSMLKARNNTYKRDLDMKSGEYTPDRDTYPLGDPSRDFGKQCSH